MEESLTLFRKYYPLETAKLENSVEAVNLNNYFEPRIQFGTAGLREICEIGSRYMNGITVVQMAQGLLQWHLKFSDKHEIVVGHDHRYHSIEFAALIANTFLQAGYKVFWLDQCSTPLSSFSSAHLRALAIMVTASHNPKEYNGIKIYLENGCQLVDPFDKEIAQFILDNLNIIHFDPTPSDKYHRVHDEMMQHYLSVCKDTIKCFPSTNPIDVVYTPIHGIGYEMVHEIVKSVLPSINIVTVAEQQQPNPDFPTVVFPNPEEKGALDLAIATAKSNDISIVIANDPDADRLALAEKLVDGSFKIFSGDQLGILLGSWLIKHSSGKRCCVSTVVSSKMFSEMAKANSVHAATCLTGFKWIASTSLKLSEQGYKLVLAYEEALGYMVGDFKNWSIKDKDGIRSMLVLINLVSHIYASNKTVFGYLDELYATYGYFGTSNGYVQCSDAALIKSVVNKLRHSTAIDTWDNAPYSYPTRIGGFRVVEIQDLNAGFDSTTFDKKTILPKQSSPMIQFKFAIDEETATTTYNGAWLTIRASGTEPKLKFYIEVAGNGTDLAKTKENVDKKAKELEDLVLNEWLKDIIE